MKLFKNKLLYEQDSAEDTVEDIPEDNVEEPVPPLVSEYRDIEEAVSRGEAFDFGERGEFAGHIYESRADGNGWTPRQHPAVWVLISVK